MEKPIIYLRMVILENFFLYIDKGFDSVVWRICIISEKNKSERDKYKINLFFPNTKNKYKNIKNSFRNEKNNEWKN